MSYLFKIVNHNSDIARRKMFLNERCDEFPTSTRQTTADARHMNRRVEFQRGFRHLRQRTFQRVVANRRRPSFTFYGDAMLRNHVDDCYFRRD